MSCKAVGNVGNVFRWKQFKLASIALGVHTRHFTISHTGRRGAVPTFQEASSPELQDVLSKMRLNGFLPAYLSPQQRKLIYSRRNTRLLEDDPVSVEIEGESFRLHFIDQARDIPNIKDAIALMREAKDFDNLPSLLEGYKMVSRKHQTCLKEQIANRCIRRAGMNGRQDVIVDCVRRVSKTGFEMNNIRIVREIMWWIQHKALVSDWDPKEAKKALEMAEQIVDLLEDERHCGGKRIMGLEDPRARPEVIGVLLELATAQAKFSGTTEDKNKVVVYSKRLLAVLADGFNVKSSVNADKKFLDGEVVRFLSPLVYSMKEALQFLESGSEEFQLLQENASRLTTELHVSLDVVKQNSDRQIKPLLCTWTYEKFFGSGSEGVIIKEQIEN